MGSKKDTAGTTQEKRKLRKLTLRLRHLSEEYDEAELLGSEYEAEFNQMSSQLRIALGLEKETPPEEEKKEPSEVSQNYNDHFKKQSQPGNQTQEQKEEKEKAAEEVRKEIENTVSSAPDWMRKVYKQIAMETHPDKVSQRDDLSIFEQAQRVGMFNKARKALEDHDGSELLQLAEELNVEADVEIGMKINMLTSKISKLQADVRKMYRTPSWIWGESHGNENIRLKLLEGYCKVLRYKVPNREFLVNFIRTLDGGGK